MTLSDLKGHFIFHKACQMQYLVQLSLSQNADVNVDYTDYQQLYSLQFT